MRPQNLDDFIGQQHLLGEKGILGQLIERDRLPPSIFWGEPGSGKTTLARIISRGSGWGLKEISAVSSGVKEVRKIIETAETDKRIGRRTILFIDEIHRFHKGQQDALLHAVEDGTLLLIGATTENPSFEVISPLLSRCRVFRFKPLSPDDIGIVIDRALREDPYLKQLGIEIEDQAREALIKYSGGDARTALNALEVAVELGRSSDTTIKDENTSTECALQRVEANSRTPNKIRAEARTQYSCFQGKLTVTLIERALMAKPGRYDKKGDYHYDIISAFIKSLRGSDPDAAVYWLVRMIEAGEDPLFIARRMVILASEDIGNCNPMALVMAQACADTVKFIGMPEGKLTLTQTALYLASSPKSNSTLTALFAATDDVNDDPDLPVPLHLRNAVTGLMRAEGYSKGYKYAHDYDGGQAEQQHLPDKLKDKVYYYPSERGVEKSIAERLAVWWPKKNRKEKS
ncbi:MAG: replication-associated recombination protein A [Candidatus Hatepunaea meridiana]|nr:replication-associated recombination protein A [Candidatus Hatepunaea meridiana]